MWLVTRSDTVCGAVSLEDHDNIRDIQLIDEYRRMSGSQKLRDLTIQLPLPLVVQLNQNLQHPRMQMVLRLFNAIKRRPEFPHGANSRESRCKGLRGKLRPAMGGCLPTAREIILKPVMPTRKDSPKQGGKLRIGDDWNAITIIAHSQQSPLKAVAELVENSIDARATKVTIIRGKEKGAPFLRVVDDGAGVPRDAAGAPDFSMWPPIFATRSSASSSRRIVAGFRESSA